MHKSFHWTSRKPLLPLLRLWKKLLPFCECYSFDGVLNKFYFITWCVPEQKPIELEGWLWLGKRRFGYSFSFPSVAGLDFPFFPLGRLLCSQANLFDVRLICWRRTSNRRKMAKPVVNKGVLNGHLDNKWWEWKFYRRNR